MAIWTPETFPVHIEPGFPYALMRNEAGHLCAPHPGAWLPRPYDSYDETRDAGAYLHQAIDIMAPIGAAVVAMDDGVVLESWRHDGETLPGVGFSTKGGNFCWIKYDSGFTSYYAHLNYRAIVEPGQRVVANQRVGAVGNTGNAHTTCAHCHLAVEDARGNKINPYPALKTLYDAGAWRLPVKDKNASMWGLVLGPLALAVFGMVAYDESRSRR